MAKTQPPNTTGHQLYLPNELDRKIKMLARYGKVDDFIIKCIEAGIEPPWKEYVTQEYARLQQDENGSSKNPGNPAAESSTIKGQQKAPRKPKPSR